MQEKFTGFFSINRYYGGNALQLLCILFMTIVLPDTVLAWAHLFMFQRLPGCGPGEATKGTGVSKGFPQTKASIATTHLQSQRRGCALFALLVEMQTEVLFGKPATHFWPQPPCSLRRLKWSMPQFWLNWEAVQHLSKILVWSTACISQQSLMACSCSFWAMLHLHPQEWEFSLRKLSFKIYKKIITYKNQWEW